MKTTVQNEEEEDQILDSTESGEACSTEAAESQSPEQKSE